MFDIGAMSKNYGLDAEQTQSVKESYQSLPPEKQASFGVKDFELLLTNKGYTFLPGGKLSDPNLDKPKAQVPTGEALKNFAKGFEGTASLGAVVMSLITKDAAEQRKINKEIKAAEAESTAQSIEEQAKEMREKAIIQLVLGVVSGAVTIAGGAIAAGKAGSALTKNLDPGAAALTNTKIGAEQQAYGGVATITNAVSQFVGTKYDAKIKDLEAKEQRSRSTVENLKDFNDSLTELIRKTIQTAESIADSTNQARSKILA
jgi:hypothetical protein